MIYGTPDVLKWDIYNTSMNVKGGRRQVTGVGFIYFAIRVIYWFCKGSCQILWIFSYLLFILDHMNHFHIWHVSPQQSCSATQLQGHLKNWNEDVVKS